jgi:hypothetical protein
MPERMKHMQTGQGKRRNCDTSARLLFWFGQRTTVGFGVGFRERKPHTRRNIVRKLWWVSKCPVSLLDSLIAVLQEFGLPIFAVPWTQTRTVCVCVCACACVCARRKEGTSTAGLEAKRVYRRGSRTTQGHSPESRKRRRLRRDGHQDRLKANKMTVSQQPNHLFLILCV